MKKLSTVCASLLLLSQFAQAGITSVRTESVSVEFSGPEAAALIKALSHAGAATPNLNGYFYLPRLMISTGGAFSAPDRSCATVQTFSDAGRKALDLNPSKACEGSESAKATALLEAVKFLNPQGAAIETSWSTEFKNINCTLESEISHQSRCSLQMDKILNITKAYPSLN